MTEGNPLPFPRNISSNLSPFTSPLRCMGLQQITYRQKSFPFKINEIILLMLPTCKLPASSNNGRGLISLDSYASHPSRPPYNSFIRAYIFHDLYLNLQAIEE
jgi:hypothetical protein